MARQFEGSLQEVRVSRGRAREFWCEVVSETVMIRLKRHGGSAGRRATSSSAARAIVSTWKRTSRPVRSTSGSPPTEIRRAPTKRAPASAEELS